MTTPADGGPSGTAGRGASGPRSARGWAGRAGRADLTAATAGAVLFGVAASTGAVLGLAGRPVRAPAAPLFAHWLPHAGPGTPAALAVAVLVVCWGPGLAERLPWRRMLSVAYLAAVCWTFSLALVDGWERGLAGRLTTGPEYLSEVPGVTDVPAALSGFAGRILDGRADSWTTHVAGHPPGALLVFVGLDRIGLAGGGWAAVVCVLAGASAAVSVPVALRALGGERMARAAAPFLVLFPGAVWVGASADGIFTGVTAAGVAALACAVSRRGRGRTALAGLAGVLLGAGCFLNYGLVLMAPLAVAVLVVGAAAAHRPSGGRLPDASPRGWPRSPFLGGPVGRSSFGPRRQLFLDRAGRPGWLRSSGWLPWIPPGAGRRFGLVPVALAGVLAVAGGFAAAGFSWLDGYHLVVQRYYQGIASDRPYAYWVWANLAALVACAGPAALPGLRRAVLEGPRSPLLLPVAAVVAVLLADLSGLSKAEVERIWLPFAVWLVAGAAALPAAGRRGWLAAQAATALLVNHLLLTVW